MKHKIFLVSFLLICIFTHNSFGQDHNIGMFRFGVQNHIAKSLPASYKEELASSSTLFEVIMDRKFVINENYILNGGLGFAIFRFSNSNLFFDGATNHSNYGLVKYGMSRSVYKDKLSINADVFHYILAHIEKQEEDQRRAFTNLEMGATYKINDRFSVTLSSALSLSPMTLLRFTTGSSINNEPITRYSGSIYNFGVHAGLGYRF
jgi:hypothetical protein